MSELANLQKTNEILRQAVRTNAEELAKEIRRRMDAEDALERLKGERDAAQQVLRRAKQSRLGCHIAPDQNAIEGNKAVEPLGEKIRAELIDWLDRNKIVSVCLDTAEHIVSIDIVKLPPEIKPVLRLWGSIYVRNEAEASLPSDAPRPVMPLHDQVNAPKVTSKEFITNAWCCPQCLKNPCGCADAPEAANAD